MTLRTRIVASLIGGFAVVGLVVIVGSFVLRRSTPSSPPTPIAMVPSGRTPLASPPSGNLVTPASGQKTPSSSQIPSSSTSPPPPSSVAPPSAPLSMEAQLGSVAFSFAETYGSYSNQGGVDNINRLRFLMSRRLNQWADQFIKERSKGDPADNTLYYGITTRALSSRVPLSDSTHLRYVVQTERVEVRGIAGNSTRSLQDLTVDFVREDGVWKVDVLTWGTARPLSGSPALLPQP